MSEEPSQEDDGFASTFQQEVVNQVLRAHIQTPPSSVLTDLRRSDYSPLDVSPLPQDSLDDTLSISSGESTAWNTPAHAPFPFDAAQRSDFLAAHGVSTPVNIAGDIAAAMEMRSSLFVSGSDAMPSPVPLADDVRTMLAQAHAPATIAASDAETAVAPAPVPLHSTAFTDIKRASAAAHAVAAVDAASIDTQVADIRAATGTPLVPQPLPMSVHEAQSIVAATAAHEAPAGLTDMFPHMAARSAAKQRQTGPAPPPFLAASPSEEEASLSSDDEGDYYAQAMPSQPPAPLNDEFPHMQPLSLDAPTTSFESEHTEVSNVSSLHDSSGVSAVFNDSDIRSPPQPVQMSSAMSAALGESRRVPARQDDEERLISEYQQQQKQRLQQQRRVARPATAGHVRPSGQMPGFVAAAEGASDVRAAAQVRFAASPARPSSAHVPSAPPVSAAEGERYAQLQYDMAGRQEYVSDASEGEDHTRTKVKSTHKRKKKKASKKKRVVPSPDPAQVAVDEYLRQQQLTGGSSAAAGTHVNLFQQFVRAPGAPGRRPGLFPWSQLDVFHRPTVPAPLRMVAAAREQALARRAQGLPLRPRSAMSASDQVLATTKNVVRPVSSTGFHRDPPSRPVSALHRPASSLDRLESAPHATLTGAAAASYLGDAAASHIRAHLAAAAGVAAEAMEPASITIPTAATLRRPATAPRSRTEAVDSSAVAVEATAHLAADDAAQKALQQHLLAEQQAAQLAHLNQHLAHLMHTEQQRAIPLVIKPGIRTAGSAVTRQPVSAQPQRPASAITLRAPAGHVIPSLPQPKPLPVALRRQVLSGAHRTFVNMAFNNPLAGRGAPALQSDPPRPTSARAPAQPPPPPPTRPQSAAAAAASQRRQWIAAEGMRLRQERMRAAAGAVPS